MLGHSVANGIHLVVAIRPCYKPTRYVIRPVKGADSEERMSGLFERDMKLAGFILILVTSCTQGLTPKSTSSQPDAKMTDTSTTRTPEVPEVFVDAHKDIQTAWTTVSTDPAAAATLFLSARQAVISTWIKNATVDGSQSPLVAGFGKRVAGRALQRSKVEPLVQWLLLETFAGRASALKQVDHARLWEEKPMVPTSKCDRAHQSRCKELRLTLNDLVHEISGDLTQGGSSSMERVLMSWKRAKERGKEVPTVHTLILDVKSVSAGRIEANLGGRKVGVKDCDQWFDILAEDHMRTMQRVARARWCKKHLRTTPKIKLSISLEDGYKPQANERLYLRVFPETIKGQSTALSLKGSVIGRFGLKTKIQGGIRTVMFPIQVNSVDFSAYSAAL